MARRSIIALVLLGIGLPWLLPLVAANDDSRLPPCCRRNGKHHCAMMDTYLRLRASGTPTFTAPPMRCPLYPRQPGLAQVRGPQNAALPQTQPAMVKVRGVRKAPQGQPRSLQQLEITHLFSKRGPPSLFLV